MDKLTIVALDGPCVPLVAQYNPREISIKKSVPWNKHKNPKGDIPMLEFTNAENRTLSMELFFDAMEASSSPLPGPAGALNMEGVRGKVNQLMDMTMINEEAGKQSDKHPPRVMVVFGGDWFRGVILSLSVKYTMFGSSGTPLRATCSLEIKEVDAVQVGK